MRIIFSLLLAAIVGLALAGPVHAEDIPYAKVETDTVRLNEILQDSKLICWEAMTKPKGQVIRHIDSEIAKRDYNKRDEVLLYLFCEAYREGASDGIRVERRARELGINRT